MPAKIFPDLWHGSLKDDGKLNSLPFFLISLLAELDHALRCDHVKIRRCASGSIALGNRLDQTVFPQVPHHTLRCADGPAYRLREAVLCDDCSPITVFGDQRQHRPFAGRKAGLRSSTAHRLFRFLALPVDRSGLLGAERLVCLQSRVPRPCPRRGCRISPTPTLLPPGPPALRQLAAFSLSWHIVILFVRGIS